MRPRTVKVPKVLAKIDAVETTSFPNQYEEALGMRKTQQERDPQPRQLLLPQPVHLPGPRPGIWQLDSLMQIAPVLVGQCGRGHRKLWGPESADCVQHLLSPVQSVTCALTTVTMPRDKNERHSSRKPRHAQAQADTLHGTTGPTSAAAAKGSGSQASQGNAGTKTSSDSRAASGPKGAQAGARSKAHPAVRPSAGAQGAGSKSKGEQKASEYGPVPSGPDAISRMVAVLEQFLLYKFKMKQPILKAEMLKFLGQRFQGRFLEMLKKASERIETLFAVRVQEVDSVTQAYDLVGELKLPNHGRVCPGKGLPKSGFLMHVLGMIFLKGNCASEEDIWRLLGTMQVYPGRKHNIYGEPRKLLTKDLVRLQYLEYRPVPNTQPPRYQFLWGPKAHAETSKMSVLQFMAKIKGTVPSCFLLQYQEALHEQEERAQALSIAGSRAKARGAAGCRAKGCWASSKRSIQAPSTLAYKELTL
ncbi:melanoma-associated antigen B5-like [Erinaceus europaeus]|uniref:Melanoma-associated antigen B5-like n=1 Tax=Erinaceus europaeus TaxID=9365 RepID=A0ABM3WU25_ERIEU|nr:melanoma-associated antigen B5-like [Erinaceus europaeus]